MAALLIVGGAACKRSAEKQAARAGVAAPQRPIEVPPEVVAYIGLRNPQSSLDDLLGIAREFFPVPFDRNGLLDLLAQRGRLPRELLASIDATGTFWLLMLDERRLGQRDAGVLVFPVRSRRELLVSLEKRMRREGRQGDLERYVPRPGQVGLTELKLVITEKHLIVPSNDRALTLTRPFIERNLLDRPPSYDLAIHVMLEGLMRDRKEDLQKQIDRTLARVRTNVPQPAEADGIDRQPVAAAADEAMRHYAEVLKSARELIVTGDVDPAQITLAVRAEGKPGGLLHKLIQRQRPAQVFGQELLPRSAWLVLTNRSNPEAAAERQKTWSSAVRGAFRRLSPGQAGRFQAALLELGQRLTGDVSVAMHRAPSGTGLALSVVAQVKGADAAAKAMEQLAGVTGEWLKEQMRKERDPALRGTSIEKQPFNKHGAIGATCSVALRYPEGKRQELTKLLGERVGVGWAFRGEHALFTVGKEAGEQLAQLALAAKAGKLPESLAESPPFRRAHNASPTRIGLLYVSLLDLARWFEGSGMEDAETIAGALKNAKVASAPSLDWGVNAARTQLDLTLRLPVEHFRAFKPILDELLKKRTAAGLNAPWPKPTQEPP